MHAAGAACTHSLDIRGALKEGIRRLRNAAVPSYTLAAELLLFSALGRDRTWIYTHAETEVDPEAARNSFSLVARRAAGEPTQYLTGKQEFWGLEFEVSPAVLIPRPETEHVVEVLLERLGSRGIKIDMKTGAPSAPLKLADIGTGSGCLAVALAHELPHATVVATDISGDALRVAQRNADRHQVADRLRFLQTNLLDAVLAGTNTEKGKCLPLFDAIVSNPPYVGLADADTLPREVRDHEPHMALFAGRMGTELYGPLIEQASALLRGRGILVVELGYNSADAVLKLVREKPGWANVSVTKDLAGIPRVLAAERLR
jgi:release factor glutamine methyltransferase